MKNRLVVALLLFTAQALSAQPQRSAPVTIRHVTVIDMTGAPAKPDMTVLISGNRIIAIMRTARFRIPREAQIIDGSGKFLIPGLWDMHVHFTEVETTFPLFIANGVTGVRNVGGDLDNLLGWRARVAAGTLVGPRIVTCGPIVDGPDPAAHGPHVVVGNATEARN
ncbi:MAG TPA: hypothetical protein VGW76_01825, partial [Pyrinomonadaceae bacterium]|nr:hypothetical protein [Pyrinomonadaceae bacterium]